MRRSRHDESTLATAEQTATPPLTAGFLLHPTAVFSVDEVRRLLRLKESSLRREIREGRLRVNKRCGKYFFIGEQLLDWLRGGELHRPPPEAKKPAD